MTLLSIAQEVTDIVGVQRPDSIAANSTTIYGQIRALIQQASDELFRRHDWQALARIKAYTTVAGAQQPDFLPADYDRMAAGQTLWDLGRDEEIHGPISPRDWAAIQQRGSGFINQYWRFIGQDVWIYPAPPAGQSLSFEYLTKNYVKPTSGSDRARWLNDDDTSYLPESLIALSAIWRWKASKGFAYAEDMANYERELERVTGAEASMAPIVVSDGTSPHWFEGYAGSPTPSGPINAAALRIRASNGYGD